MNNSPLTAQNQPLQTPQTPTSSPRHSLIRAAVITPFILVVLLPIAMLWWTQEVAYWQVAAARELRLDGNLSAAKQLLDEALPKLPVDAALRLERAKLQLEMKDYAGALDDLERVLELAPSSETALSLRSSVYQHLGDKEKSIADCNTLVELHPHSQTAIQALQRASVLNTRAYLRALNEVEIEAAIEDIELALQLLDDVQRMLQHEATNPLQWLLQQWEQAQLSGDEAMPLQFLRAQMLDTRGYLYYLANKPELLPKAQADLDLAIRGCEQALPRQMQQVNLLVDQRDIDQFRKPILQGLATLHYHRALIFARLGEEIKAGQDRERAKTLGLDLNNPHATF